MYIQKEESEEMPLLDKPYLDMRISEDMMKHLWNCVNASTAKKVWPDMPGEISKQAWLVDKDGLFFKTALREPIRQLYYRNWNNYYDSITKTKPTPIFSLVEMWVNYQRQYDFNPPHNHISAPPTHPDTENRLFSFVVFMQIPTYYKEQHKLPNTLHGFRPHASDFLFIWPNKDDKLNLEYITLNPEDEGRMLFFPAHLTHQVFPFYGTEKERITISGNLIKN